MKQSYNTPMLSIVSIKKNDIVTASQFGVSETQWTTGDALLAPDRSWEDAGY